MYYGNDENQAAAGSILLNTKPTRYLEGLFLLIKKLERKGGRRTW